MPTEAEVSPLQGDVHDKFTYSVSYFDADDETPALGFVMIEGNTIWVSGQVGMDEHLYMSKGIDTGRLAQELKDMICRGDPSLFPNVR